MERKFCFILLATVILTGLTFCEKETLILEIPKVADNETNQKNDSVPQNANLNPCAVPYTNDYSESVNFNPDLTYDSVKDVDGNVYRAIKIGSQTWMAKNLRTIRYNDGGNIFKGFGAPAGYTDWFDLHSGAYVWYDNGGPSKWGAFYNFFAVSNNLCPSGWHVPSYTEWQTLIQFLGGEKAALGKLMISGTNESGFSAFNTAVMCGFGFCKGSPVYWTSTLKHSGYSASYAYCVSLYVDRVISDCWEPQSYGFNVRCMKDN